MNSSRSGHGQINQALSFQAVQGLEPDRSYYLTHKLRHAQQFLTRTLNDISHSVWEALSFDHVDLSTFQQAIWPTIASGAAFVVGEYAAQFVKAQTGDEDAEYMAKFLVGTAFLGYAVSHRLTEEKPQTLTALSAATAREVLAITYLYQSTYAASHDLFSKYTTDSGAMILSLGASVVVAPGLIAHAVHAYQSRAVKKAYAQGAQRSDTALFSSGQTPVMNIYLQANYFLMTELSTVSREFQLGLISYNILHTKNLLQQFRNLPALIVDTGPPIVKKLLAQQEKIADDYRHNTALQQVLGLVDGRPQMVPVPRYQLRKYDSVWCDDAFNSASVPVSGELIALERDATKQFTLSKKPIKFRVNLKSHNGEDVWIEYTTNTQDPDYQYVDLHKIRDGKQAGVLTGAKLNLNGGKDFFIRVKEEAERNLDNQYEKTAVINQVITKNNQNSVIQAIGLSVFTAALLTQDPAMIPGKSLQLGFNLYQMMIRFSETFLRETINGRLMKDLNANLGHHPLATIDALRIVDLCSALDGYYPDRFPRGVAIVSDKTGTLTTSLMDVLGFWTEDMPGNVQAQLAGRQSPLYSEDRLDACFDSFAEAYTNNKKELEPEEYAMLTFFENEYKAENMIAVDSLGNNHFRKKVTTPTREATIETWHLGLYRPLGGRFTLASDGDKQYLVFCGVPRAEAFHDTPLLQTYTSMRARVGVLSRDWCIARTEVTAAEFNALRDLFNDDDKPAIEALLMTGSTLLSRLEHQGTFLIDNPVKKAAETFILNCQNVRVPVFIATGDTVKAAENIAKVLAPDSAQHIVIVRQDAQSIPQFDPLSANATVVFAGVNDALLVLFDQLMLHDVAHRPVIIFAEMSTEGKGILTRHLKKQGYFVVANGDGTNDVAMMKSADMVIAHLTDDGTYAPGVGPLANLNDEQLRRLLHSNASFYDLFDIGKPQSVFKGKFAALANTQEKPSYALMLKSCKMSFELAQSFGLPHVEEMWQQHWFSVAFDLIWLGIAFHEILASKNLPFDNKHLNASSFVRYTQFVTLAVATVQALLTYAVSGKSTNVESMILMLCALPLILRSIFSGYGYLRDETYQAATTPLVKHTIFGGSLDKAEIKETQEEVVQSLCHGALAH